MAENGTSAAAPVTTVGQSDLQGPPLVTKKTPKDFIFGKVIGEGSFSTVYIAKDVNSEKEYAIKVCDKRHIIKERKQTYIKQEKDVLNLLRLGNPVSPFFVTLFCTFQDTDRLYFVMTYAKNGELLPYINRVGCFDIKCSQFYSAEIVLALEYMHSLRIIHRDLKPENILLSETMHILITDFGSAKIVPPQDSTDDLLSRKNSFVGTAQYVSPELLRDKSASYSSDLWALGCIIYQMVSGLPPFIASNEYQIFQKIMKLEFEYPDGFNPSAKNVITKLLMLEPELRLGATDQTEPGPFTYESLRSDSFFNGIQWHCLHEQTPPTIYPYLPGTSGNEELRSSYKVPDHLEPGLDDKQMTRLLGLTLSEEDNGTTTDTTTTSGSSSSSIKRSAEQDSPSAVTAPPIVPSPVARSFSPNGTSSPGETQQHTTVARKISRKVLSSWMVAMDAEGDERTRWLTAQAKDNVWHRFVENNLIYKQGFVDKRKGLFSRRRMLLLTSGPHLYYVDPVGQVLKGQIPWSPELRPEAKNFKTFFVHTPMRTYYLEDPEGFALDWCRAINEVRKRTYNVHT